MTKGLKFIEMIFLVCILSFTSIVIPDAGSTRAVDYTINITDPTDDVYGENYDTALKNDADITSLTSSESGGVITFKLTVAGTIHGYTSAGDVEYLYTIYIDTDSDGWGEWDILIMKGYSDTDEFDAIMEDENFDYYYELSGDNVAGDNTDTLTIKFPLSNIKEEITGWDIYAETDHYDYTSENYTDWMDASDTVPDDGFSVDPYADSDSDGMLDWWEAQYGLNKSDPSDANSDPDSDNFTNLEEYDYDSDPTDPQSHPPSQDPNIKITITKPALNETINASSNYLDYYLITGTAEAPTGQYIEDVEWRVPGSYYDYWDYAYDTSASSDWSTWEAYLPTYSVDGYGYLVSGMNTIEVKAITDQSGYNTASVKINFDASTGDTYGDYEFWEIIFDGSDVEVYGPFGVWYEGTFTIDPDKDPKEINITITDNSEDTDFNDKTSLGVYKISDEILYISLNEPGMITRPSADFIDEGNNQVFYMILDTAGTGATELDGSWYGSALYYYDYYEDDIYEWDELTETYPFTSTPTNTSIDVAVTSSTISYQMQWDKDSFYILAKGTTSGVDHCKISFVEFYSDGTNTEEVYWEEEIDMKEFTSEIEEYMADAGMQIDAWHFKPTSANWKNWEYQINMTFTYEELGLEDFELDIDESELESLYAEFMPIKIEIYVRAYADAEETSWNQASLEVDMQQRAGKGNNIGINFVGEAKAEIEFEGDGDLCVQPIEEVFLDKWSITDETFGDDYEEIGKFILIDVMEGSEMEWLIIKIEYDPASLPEDIDEEDLRIFYFDGTKWIRCEDTWIDEDNNLIYANVTHLTIFAPLAESGGGPGGGPGDEGTDDSGTEALGMNLMVILGLVAVIFVIAVAAGVIILRRRSSPFQPPPPPPPPETKSKKEVEEEEAAEEEGEEKEMKEEEMIEAEWEDDLEAEWEEEAPVDLSQLEQVTKNCPNCKTPIEVEASFDDNISLQCPKCGSRGKIPNPYLDEIEKLKENKDLL